ncbi:hypothetical protein EYZ11_007163 [Aspergillus tanneri]|uniref:Hydroxymethylglutaryl-CoA synthase n=1 Tax=Aspergillus tanneri TaxID=1220188 RepID=A0A4S3JJB7_9EURO|nr:hypothetical protein EYZ11_007163 [Aspergillus tanneri]
MGDDRANIGIKAIEIYFPNQYVEQQCLEAYDNASPGKYTVGLGQCRMSFCDDQEDIYSMALTALSSLLRKYSIDPTSIGRLEVGTESACDRSKSVKSVLMQLLTASGNTDVEGADTTNACYGGTNALFNSINWIESSAWDGRDAVVIAGDIALYQKGSARPTGGAGCVAMLIGPNAPIVVEPGLRGSYASHVYDFYKPDGRSEYPVINGHFSVQCYMESLDACYKAYIERGRKTIKEKVVDFASPSWQLPSDKFDYMLFHSPTCKLVEKAHARVLYNDYTVDPDHPFFAEVPPEYHPLAPNPSKEDKERSRFFMKLCAERFKRRVLPSLEMASMCGNMYTASLYGCLASLISNVTFHDKNPKRVALFSYGKMAAKLDLKARLQARYSIPPVVYDVTCQLREQAYMAKDYVPFTTTDYLIPGTYYLSKVNKMFEREYQVKA